MPPFSLRAALGKYEFAVAFGKSDDASDAPDEDADEEDGLAQEFMPVLTEIEREPSFGFRRWDRPDAY